MNLARLLIAAALLAAVCLWAAFSAGQMDALP